MDGGLAQCIALAAHGRAILADRMKPVELLETNTTFQYVREVRFLDQAGKTACRDTLGWFAALRQRGATRLRLIERSVKADLPDHLGVAFAGFDPWGIQVDLRKQHEMWVPAWEVAQKHKKDNRIWRVTYWPVGLIPSPMQDDVSRASAELRDALEAIRDFACSEASDWVAWFDKALDCLRSDRPPPYHADMLPAVGYARAARRLLAAASQAWVFGGMGSWNDIGVEKPQQARYNACSERLYRAVVGACCTTTNSFPTR